MSRSKPTILVVGATGKTGSMIVAHLEEKYANDVNVRPTSRRQEQVDQWKAHGKDAALLDLDDPSTFGPALCNVDRAFLVTSYTVDMLVHAKTFVDAAVKAGVFHIVHLGSFGNWDCTAPNFVWNLMVETYIQASRIKWTNLRPNFFADNLTSVMPVQNGKFQTFLGDRRVGWIALEDVAEVGAKALAEGPTKHHGKNYWLSTESMNGEEMAKVLTKAVGKRISYEEKTPSDFKELIESTDIGIEKTYAKGLAENLQQMYDGRMAYIATVRTDVPYLLGRPGMSMLEWAKRHKEQLLS